MGYASISDLQNVFGEAELIQLTDRTGDGIADSGVLESALTYADDTINGYLLTRYNLPLSAVPDRIKGSACDIARYRLWGDAVSEIIRQRHHDAIAWLRDLSAGRATLAGSAALSAAKGGGIAASDIAPVFTDAALRGL